MSTAGKISANRANARASAGPKTARGKAHSARNARRHGLSIPLLADPAFSKEVEALARDIAGAAQPICFLCDIDNRNRRFGRDPANLTPDEFVEHHITQNQDSFAREMIQNLFNSRSIHNLRVITQQLLCRRIHLRNGDRFDAKRRVRDEATIARTRIALKRILDDTVIRCPRPPTA